MMVNVANATVYCPPQQNYVFVYLVAGWVVWETHRVFQRPVVKAKGLVHGAGTIHADEDIGEGEGDSKVGSTTFTQTRLRSMAMI